MTNPTREALVKLIATTRDAVQVLKSLDSEWAKHTAKCLKEAADTAQMELDKPMIHIAGRRWFQKSYGNTYHSCTVTVGDDVLLKSGSTYGYGDMYMQTAYSLLQGAGYFGGVDYHGFMQYVRDNRSSTVFTTCIDVDRERDL